MSVCGPGRGIRVWGWEADTDYRYWYYQSNLFHKGDDDEKSYINLGYDVVEET